MDFQEHGLAVQQPVDAFVDEGVVVGTFFAHVGGAGIDHHRFVPDRAVEIGVHSVVEKGGLRFGKEDFAENLLVCGDAVRQDGDVQATGHFVGIQPERAREHFRNDARKHPGCCRFQLLVSREIGHEPRSEGQRLFLREGRQIIRQSRRIVFTDKIQQQKILDAKTQFAAKTGAQGEGCAHLRRRSWYAGHLRGSHA